MEDYYEFNQVEETQIALNEYKSFNDPVRAFWGDHNQDFAWDLLPYSFTYDCYKKWMAETMPSSQPLGRNTFIKDIAAACAKQPGEILDYYLDGTLTLQEAEAKWVALGTQDKMPSAGLMTHSEPMIEQYDLVDTWGAPNFPAGSAARSIPNPKRYYAGLVRAHAWLAHYLGQANIDAIESARAQNTSAAFTFDPSANTVTQIAAAPTNTVTSTNVTPLITNDTANTPDTPQYAPSPVTPRVAPKLTVVNTNTAQDTDATDDAATTDAAFDPDRDLDVNFKPINHDADADTDAPNNTAAPKTPVTKRAKRAQKKATTTTKSNNNDKTDPKNLPWDHPDHPLNDPARQPSPTNPAVPVAEFVPQAAPTDSDDAGDDLTGNTSTTDNTTDSNSKDNNDDGTDAD